MGCTVSGIPDLSCAWSATLRLLQMTLSLFVWLLSTFYSPNCCLSPHYTLCPDLAAVPALVRDLHRLQHQPPLVRVRRILDLGDSLVCHDSAHHGDHLDPVAGGVDELVDCEEAGVPVPDPWHLSKQRLRRCRDAGSNKQLFANIGGGNKSVCG